ncbi:hypothetical protein Bca52824_062812 [Brassica carinata]|uniref:Uncharacterized protein n=1 Tax=Brassica carinata TaxID=52824 RepID=A0A8X7QFA6_BRACI|nr:hypothetical protein Bca52824_062812 [Brassica carinata]
MGDLSIFCESKGHLDPKDHRFILYTFGSKNHSTLQFLSLRSRTDPPVPLITGGHHRDTDVRLTTSSRRDLCLFL